MASTICRSSANYGPSMWDSTFPSFAFPNSVFESYCAQVEAMKKEVKAMLMDSMSDPVKNIEFIDLLCRRLGVSYHYEKEIEEQLNNIFSLPISLKITTLTYTLRHFCFEFSDNMDLGCLVMYSTNSRTMNVSSMMTDDVRGMLTLYEASYVSLHGEDIMEEALSFARNKWEHSLTLPLSPHLAKHIKAALILPFHEGLPRLETRQYITFYQKEEHRNEALLRFAKLDFNRVQLLHQQELAILSSIVLFLDKW